MESRQVVMDVPVGAPAAVSEQTQKFSLFALTMMVVGSMVGAGRLYWRKVVCRWAISVARWRTR